MNWRAMTPAQKVNTVIAAWRPGHSAKDIAEHVSLELGHRISRSVVIGMYARNLVLKRNYPLQKPSRESTDGEVRRPRREKSAEEVLALESLPDQPQPVKVKSSKEEALLYDQAARSIPLADLESDECRWPINEPDQAKRTWGIPVTTGFLFCGHPVHPGKPYCHHHWLRGRGKILNYQWTK